MNFKNFKMIALLAIAGWGITACQSNEEPLQLKQQAQEPELPATINIVSAQDVPTEGITTRASNSITAQQVAGTYNGLLYDVNMNNKLKNDVPDVKIEIKQQSNNKIKFYLSPFKVGKMPGTLSVDIDNLSLNPDGTFHADEQNNQSLLRKKLHLVGWFGHYKYDVTLIEGSFTPVLGGYKLKMTLESKGSIIGIEIFKAHVKYDGNQL